MSQKHKNKDIVILSLMIITFLIVAGISLSQIISMSINDGITNQNSDKGLTCKIKIDTNTTVNITWYKGGVQNRTSNISCTNGVECSTSEGSGNVPNNDTRKNDVWMCKAEFINGTGGYESNNVSVTIVDTPPYQPRIFYSSNGTEILNETVTIAEDSVKIFNVTSWDWDGDTITYILDSNPSFCNITSSTGIMTCAPTLESHIKNWTFSVGAKTGAITGNGRDFSINITPVNDAPRFIPALSNQNFTEGLKFNYYIIGADDENNTPLDLIVVNVTPYLDLTINRSSNTSFILKLRNNDTVGYAESKLNYTVTLSINDTDNLTFNSKNTTASFQLIGVSFNHLPNISYVVYNNNSLTQGGNLNIYVNATDIDNNTLIFSTGGLNSLYPVTYTSSTDYNVTVNASSFAYAYINFTGMNNSHVVTHNFTIYVFDTKDNATQVINMFINNTNDAPQIFEMSNNVNNSLNNKNLSNLTGYTGVLFKYKINATDIDDLTYDYNITGISTYYTNDSMFSINSTTGWLSFTVNTSGNYTFMINVTDYAGAMSNRSARIEILANHNPTFTPNIINLSCREYDAINNPSRCYWNLSLNVSDLDNLSAPGDYIADYWTNSTIFVINSTTGVINFSANQSMVGNYSIMFNVTDSRGGISSTNIYMFINNTNNAPNMSFPNVPVGNFLVGMPYQITYNVTDLDLLLPPEYSYENLTFIANITGSNTSIFSFTKISETEAILMINSSNGADHEGNYSINVTVNDTFNNKSSRFINIYIYNNTNAPTINQIIPSGTPWNDTINNVTWMNVSSFPGRMTTITAYENRTYTFNQTSTADNSSYPNHLDYQWYYDGTPTVQTQHYSPYFDFFSSGTHNITIVVTDQFYSSASFTWYVDVNNVNRPPIYYPNSLENLTITRSTSIPGYLTHLDLRTRFYDPDDDPSNSGYNTDFTTNSTFSSSICDGGYANFSFENHILNIDAIAIGECYVMFIATDPANISMTASSEIVLINITNISRTVSDPIEIPINVESTGGGTNPQPLPIPLPQEVEKPKPLQLITPKLVTTYKNSTIKIPIVVNNTWNDTLVGIMLEAYTNASNVSLYLDRIYIPKLSKGEVVEAMLYVQNYKSEGHYEIQVRGNVTIPDYSDTATIFINSAEMRSEGEELENKISFAKDLLSSNPECQELNELLSQAQKELNAENYAGTAKIVDSVLNGCKFLVNNAKKNKEVPERNFIKTFEWKKSYNDYIIIGIFGMLFLASLYYILKKDNPEQDF